MSPPSWRLAAEVWRTTPLAAGRRRTHPRGMHTLTDIKTGFAIALLATVLAWVALADGAKAAGGGNAANAKLCQKGGWSTLMNTSAQQFSSEDACVGYAAHGAAVY